MNVETRGCVGIGGEEYELFSLKQLNGDPEYVELALSLGAVLSAISVVARQCESRCLPHPITLMRITMS